MKLTALNLRLLINQSIFQALQSSKEDESHMSSQHDTRPAERRCDYLHGGHRQGRVPRQVRHAAGGAGQRLQRRRLGQLRGINISSTLNPPSLKVAKELLMTVVSKSKQRNRKLRTLREP